MYVPFIPMYFSLLSLFDWMKGHLGTGTYSSWKLCDEDYLMYSIYMYFNYQVIFICFERGYMQMGRAVCTAIGTVTWVHAQIFFLFFFLFYYYYYLFFEKQKWLWIWNRTRKTHCAKHRYTARYERENTHTTQTQTRIQGIHKYARSGHNGDWQERRKERWLARGWMTSHQHCVLFYQLVGDLMGSAIH